MQGIWALCVITMVIGIGGSVSALAQNDAANESPGLRRSVVATLETLLPEDTEPDRILVLTDDEPSEVERYAATLVQFYLREKAYTTPEGPPVRARPNGSGLPDELDRESRWKLRRSGASWGVIVRIADGENTSRLLLGRYAPGGREADATADFGLEDPLQFLRDTSPSELSSRDRQWLNLLTRLFPECQTEDNPELRLALAEGAHFFRRGFWEKAARRLAAAAEQHPASCILRRTIALQLAGQTDEALEDVEKAIQIKPDSGPLYALKSWILLRSEARDDALMVLQQARLSDMAREGLYRLARHFLALERENPKAAEEALEKATELLPDNGFVQLTAARYFWQEARLQEAIERFRAAIKAGADNQDVWTELGMALDASGKPQEAIDAFRKAFEKAPANVSVARHLASMLRTAGRYDEALKVLSRAARSGPDRPEVFVAWGDAAADMWRTDEAQRAYRQAVKIDGPDAHTGMARMLARKGRFNKAEKILKDVIERHPDHGEAYLTMAEILNEKGLTAEARKKLEQGLQQGDSEGPLHLALSRMQRSAGDFTSAIHAAQVAVAAESSCRAYAMLAMAFTANEEYDKAEAALESGRQTGGSCPELLIAAGHLHAARDELTKALEAVERALQIDPHLPGAMIFAGELHLRMDNPEECARFWSRAAELDRWNARLEWRVAELLSKRLSRPGAAAPHYERHAGLGGEHAEQARRRARECKLAGNQESPDAQPPDDMKPLPEKRN